jgi:hypothetical protein
MDEGQTKTLRGTEGVGTVTPQVIEERAREIARADGRAESNDRDRIRAREDVIGAKSLSEQSSTVSEPDRDWYTPRGSSGQKAPSVRPEDEENIPEKLIQEGIEEEGRITKPKEVA